MADGNEIRIEARFSKQDIADLDDFCLTGMQLGGMVSKSTYAVKKVLFHLLRALPPETEELIFTSQKQEGIEPDGYVYVKTKIPEKPEGE